MFLTVLIIGIIFNAIGAAVMGLTASDEAKGFKRNLLISLAALFTANMAAFLTIYASHNGISH